MAAPAGNLTGRDCYSYYNAGTFGTPTWTLMTRVIDLTYQMAAEWADVSSRASVWKMEAKALVGLIVNFGYRYKNATDAVFAALRGYAMGVTKQELALADGVIATTGTQYLRATYQFEIGQFGQQLTSGVQVDFSAHLCYEEDSNTMREPAWTTV
jgi:hypothetical protein